MFSRVDTRGANVRVQRQVGARIEIRRQSDRFRIDQTEHMRLLDDVTTPQGCAVAAIFYGAVKDILEPHDQIVRALKQPRYDVELQ